MSSLFIEYPKCTTCQKAKKWLDEQGISYEDRHIVEQNPTAEELRSWIEGSGLPAKKFFNTDILLKMLEDHRDGKNTNEKTDDSRKIWTVYIFLVWYDRFFEHGKPIHPSVNAR